MQCSDWHGLHCSFNFCGIFSVRVCFYLDSVDSKRRAWPACPNSQGICFYPHLPRATGRQTPVCLRGRRGGGGGRSSSSLPLRVSSCMGVSVRHYSQVDVPSREGSRLYLWTAESSTPTALLLALVDSLLLLTWFPTFACQRMLKFPSSLVSPGVLGQEGVRRLIFHVVNIYGGFASQRTLLTALTVGKDPRPGEAPRTVLKP